MTEKNGNRSAVENAAQDIAADGKATQQAAFRLSVAPMMDWAVLSDFRHKSRGLRA